MGTLEFHNSRQILDLAPWLTELMKSDLQCVLCVFSLSVCEGMAVVCGRAAGELPRDSISTFGADMTRLLLASISFENIFKFTYLNLNKIRTDVGRSFFGKIVFPRWGDTSCRTFSSFHVIVPCQQH